MPDTPTLTTVEEAAGVRLEATRRWAATFGKILLRDEAVDELLALIMRLAGERDYFKEHLRMSREEVARVVGGNELVKALRQAEADLADVRQKRADEHDQHQRDYDRVRADIADMTRERDDVTWWREYERGVQAAFAAALMESASQLRLSVLGHEWSAGQMRSELAAVRAVLGGPDGPCTVENISARMKEVEAMGCECAVAYKERELSECQLDLATARDETLVANEAITLHVKRLATARETIAEALAALRTPHVGVAWPFPVADAIAILARYQPADEGGPGDEELPEVRT